MGLKPIFKKNAKHVLIKHESLGFGFRCGRDPVSAQEPQVPGWGSSIRALEVSPGPRTFDWLSQPGFSLNYTYHLFPFGNTTFSLGAWWGTVSGVFPGSIVVSWTPGLVAVDTLFWADLSGKLPREQLDCHLEDRQGSCLSIWLALLRGSLQICPLVPSALLSCWP